MTLALLNEIVAGLEGLANTAEPVRIDLRRLPLPNDGISSIRQLLGKGEVNATVKGVGSCSFEETAIAGVWWGTQRNTVGDVVGEFIEIATIPELLKADRAEIDAALQQLRQRLAEVVSPDSASVAGSALS